MSSPRVALVTGGTRGIGLGIAQCLAREGHQLVVCGIRDEPAASPSLEILRSQGGEVFYCQCDVANAVARDAMIAETKDRFGGLHVLVNNAGIAPRERCDMMEAGEESFEHLMKTNLQGPYFLTQQVANWMVEQQAHDPEVRCCIINISSISATFASVNRGDYCISKAGVSMATQLWAIRLAEYGIGVFEVRPGIIATDMTSGVKEKYDALIADGVIPQNRWGQPEDCGRVVASLARGDFAYSTGQVILVDGGLSLPWI